MDRASPRPARGRLVGLVLRHRRLVAVFWLAVTAAGILLAGQVTGRFSPTQELPGLPSYRAAVVLQQSYGISNNPPAAVVVTLPAGERIVSPAGRADLARILRPLSTDRSLHVVSYLPAGDRKLVSGSGRSALALVYGGAHPPASAQLASRTRSSAPPGAVIHATSLNDLASGASSGSGIGVLAEGLMGGAAALLVLAVVFGSLLALVLGTLLGFAASLSAGEPRPGSLATAGPAHDGLAALRQAGFPGGVLAPIEIIVPDSTSGALAGQLTGLSGVYATIVAPGAQWHQAGTALLQVLPAAPTSSRDGNAAVASVRGLAARVSPRALVTGDGPFEADVVSALYRRFPVILGLVAVFTLLLLTRVFRSVVLPVRALALNVLSVGASYGALVLIWQYGYGSRAIWGIPATGVIVDFVPLMVFAFQFGLSMDYEVFIVSRIREAHDTGLSTGDATVEGIARTGRLVTSAALILFLAFAALAAGPQTSIKIFATGLGAGILLDAIIVRALLLPALISLLGQRNWWLPRPIAHLMRCPPAPSRPGELARFSRPPSR